MNVPMTAWAAALHSAPSTAEVVQPDLRTWALALGSVAAISLVALLGALTFLVRSDRLHRVLPYVVSVAAGSLLGSAFVHLLPEIARDGMTRRHALLVLVGVVLFFVFERFVHWHHHGHAQDHAVIAPYAWLNLTGDALHNFVDGLLIATAFSQSTSLGFTTTLAVALHEIPQELGDVGVLLLARMSRGRALLFNVMTGGVALVGAVIGLLLGGRIPVFHDTVLAVTAGGFIYIAAADLIPELHRERRAAASLLQVACLLGGIALMFALD